MTERHQSDAFRKIGARLEKTVTGSRELRHGILLVHSDRYGLHWRFTTGTNGPDCRTVCADQPYHVASIGKTFTSMVIARLYERGLLSYGDPIADYLSGDLLQGLFLYRGTDYSRQVLVRQLLNHTSGIADYFDDRPLSGEPIKERILSEPQRLWTPDDTIAFTRNTQRAVAPPGRRFHYSDTGYNLLGKIIETVSGLPFHENLRAEIFDPLGMDESYLMFHGSPRSKSGTPPADVYLGEQEVSRYRSLSIDWAGGGIVSTTEDLLRFHRSLVHHTLVRRETLDLCGVDRGRFGFGMDYGYGLLFLNARRMTLVMPRSLSLWGNFGSIGAYMFYNPAYDVFLIGTFNHSSYRVRQVPFVIGTMRAVRRHCIAS
ncbi:MAG: beta-lactamase family protein [Spirochaetes bacterium]|nr:beta-lactamase family protein [Spirochaetota bacterium]